ncbi:PD40 domain-containing protein [Nocardia huaxiensis]|uniref:PD40 domain-containing protein n=1 Tax=Nocardia huaxiensis TaxID=2755382 RepID=A0A7D6VC24_9NOCA|nr:PD40 domain-containing protein [Nocardia huaxiensis]QLY29297.1 PD40 domain-containing protein [Nocardia huaxiensis]
MSTRQGRISRGVVLAVVLAGLLAYCGIFAGKRPAPTPVPDIGLSPYPAKIVFSGNGGTGGTRVYAMNPDGTGVTGISAGQDPALSRDGSMLALGRPLTVMRPDGSHRVQLVNDGADPAFSADGTRIAFVCDRSICVVDTDGSDQKTLTGSLGVGLQYPQRPAFSPDGTLIVFNVEGDIWIMDSDGDNLRPLLKDEFTNFSAVFTPDGSGIAFASGRCECRGGEVYLMDLYGRNIRPLTGEGTALPAPEPYYSTTLPAYSPDGTRLLVTRWTENSAKVMTGSEIWVMNPDGSDPRRLTAANQAARAASWGGNPAL